MGDYADWRSLYQTSVFFWRGLRSAAEALSEVEPETGARFRQQAADFHRAIIRAADRAIVLTPVIRVSDRTYRRYIPPQPYLRCLCEQITNPFGGAHAGSLVMDRYLGAAALGLIPGEQRRARRPATHRAVKLGEAHAVGGKRVQVRSRDLAAITTRVRKPRRNA
jgi:hypothetical protein